LELEDEKAQLEYIWHSITLRTVKKGEVYPKTYLEGRKGEYRYNSTLCLTSALDGGGWLMPRLARFTPGNEPVPIFTLFILCVVIHLQLQPTKCTYYNLILQNYIFRATKVHQLYSITDFLMMDLHGPKHVEVL
jgi:hypothetical protein